MKTDLDKIKDMAVNFLCIDPTPVCPEKFGNLFVSHPYFDTELVYLRSTNEMVRIFEQPDMFNKWRQEMADFIRSQKDVVGILMLIRAPYLLVFFKYICDALSEKDFAAILRYCYTHTEFPSNDIDVSKTIILKWFKQADAKFLMDKDERKYLASLPDILTIFRGVCDRHYRDGLSWTLDKNQAKWFAKRFSYENKTAAVYECQVPKSAVLAFWNDREREVILDYNYLKNCEVKEYEVLKDAENES